VINLTKNYTNTMSTKRIIKVSFHGETKRIKMTNSYESLAL